MFIAALHLPRSFLSQKLYIKKLFADAFPTGYRAERNSLARSRREIASPCQQSKMHPVVFNATLEGVLNLVGTFVFCGFWCPPCRPQEL